MALHIYNSLSRQKEQFIPIKANTIGMYVCGMTVYDYCHLGHARLMVCFDVIVRYLRSRGYAVTYVRNITDIDDKIINRAHENNEPVEALTERFIKALHDDLHAINILPPDHEPRATQHVDNIIKMIETLVAKEYAYIAENGDVYYDVTRFADYGKLSHKDVAGQEAGARVDIVDVKRNPLDFVLWKMAKADEPSWTSPWGEGRPGWHIECSAMSTECLGDTFDIHGGGFDLQFPHHENEIAQSEAATGKKPFAKTWMHVGFLQINREKMSKSLGNFFTIRHVLEKYSAEVVRYFLLSSQYRSQLNYSEENLDLAKSALERFYTCLRDLPDGVAPVDSSYEQHFIEVMDDDFNTPEALAVLFEMTHQINQLKQTDITAAANLAALLKKLSNYLGILENSPDVFLQGAISDEQKLIIENLISERNQARRDKNWQRADEIRKQLRDMKIELEDNAEGTTWRVG